MIDDEPAGRAQRARPEPAAVAVAAEHQQIGVLGGGDHLPLDPALPGSPDPPAAGTTVSGQPAAAASSSSCAVVIAAWSTVARDLLAAPEQPGERPVHDLLGVVQDVDQLDIAVRAGDLARGVHRGRPARLGNPHHHPHADLSSRRRLTTR